jgi:hypothetical protein
MLVLEGLQGNAIAEMCPAHPISPLLYEQWRDPLLAHAATAVEVHQPNRREARREQENAQLKPLGGELCVERKKSDERWG